MQEEEINSRVDEATNNQINKGPLDEIVFAAITFFGRLIGICGSHVV